METFTINREVELLAIGAGPSNLALAVALEELAPDDLARNSLIVERAGAVQWQEGLLLPWAKSQASFLKDLVTLRNPQSEFSFLNYLHSVGRLDEFINMGSLTPYRIETSEYFQWAANALSKVEVKLNCGCTSIEPSLDSGGGVTRWLARFADGSSVTCRYLVVGIGRDRVYTTRLWWSPAEPRGPQYPVPPQGCRSRQRTPLSCRRYRQRAECSRNVPRASR